MDKVSQRSSSLSDLTLIYCGKADFGHFPPSFSFNRTTISLKRVRKLSQIGLPLATTGQVRQAASARLALILACWLGFFPCITAAASATPVASAALTVEVRIAVLAFRGTARAERRWAATMAYLGERIPGYRFRAIPMDLAELDRAVVAGGIDFAITNTGQYIRTGSKHGMSWLATLKSRRHRGLGPVIGSALVVRQGSPYRTLEDLRDTRLGAVSPLAFGGAQIYWGEIVARGYRPGAFFGNIRFSGFPVDALAFWVRDGLVDAAVLPACLLETLGEEGVIAASALRVIDPIPHPGFNCQASSRLYPNWSISTLKSTSAELAGQVVSALLLMPADSAAAQNAGARGWTAPVSSYDIHQLYRRLDIHPWQEPWWQDLRRWVLHNWQWSLTLLAAMLLGLGHHLWVQLMVQRRTRELQTANDELMDRQRQLEHAQRVAILGELSSDLAHELNQPLAAINSYAEGGIVRLKTAGMKPDLSDLLGRISAEAQRGGRIIQRVRGFARKEPARRERVELSALIRETLKLLDYELKKQHLELELRLPDAPLRASVDPVEIQQLLVNLIRNGMEAMTASPQPHRLRVGCEQHSSGEIMISVEDSGEGVDEAQVEVLFKPFYSTKPQGLGLGMSICRRIVEAHDGEIRMLRGVNRGTRVVCVLRGCDNG
ncbi:MAG: PhnD/SsuA/transferrin family substrate-binding protein [Motiliproteus sp.]